MRVNRAIRRFVASRSAVRAAAAGARLAPGVLRALIRFEADVRAEDDVMLRPWRP